MQTDFSYISQATYEAISRCLKEELPLTEPRLAQIAGCYLEHPGKAIRPVLLTLCCQACGGTLGEAIPAAAAVEMYHTSTLMLDDIIDHDNLRRGRPAAHVQGAELARTAFHSTGKNAVDYGTSLSLLGASALQAAASWMLSRTPSHASLVNLLVQRMNQELIPALVSGEQWDVTLSLRPWNEICEKDILRMMEGKTGALLAFSAKAGALIGEKEVQTNTERQSALGKFAILCGTAFQLQDDLLGVFGDEKDFGKPVGSDIREGKRTLLALYALRNASECQRESLLSLLGNTQATPEEISLVQKIFTETGARTAIEQQADQAVNQACSLLRSLELPREAEGALLQWAARMTHRNL